MLPEREDALSVFQPRLQSLVLDAIYNIMKFTLSTQSPGLRQTLSSTQSIDQEYLKRVIDASYADKAKQDGESPTRKKVSVEVNVPAAQA